MTLNRRFSEAALRLQEHWFPVLVSIYLFEDVPRVETLDSGMHHHENEYSCNRPNFDGMGMDPLLFVQYHQRGLS